MSKNKKFNRIRKSDFDRVLITETLPFETPIIFSNNGLYQHIKNASLIDPIIDEVYQALITGSSNGNPVTLGGKTVNSTTPYLYKIRKNSFEYRRLGLAHPYSQWKIKEFYEKYGDLILYFCSRSPATIRAPRKVAGSFYTKNSNENLNQYRTIESLNMLESEDKTKHSPTYFSYKGYNRLYKFFESYEYFDLEKKFESLLTLDVSKCFDSIYTHSLSWAIKDKQFTKKFVTTSTTFAQQFDEIIRHANYNETHGILIGPEVSRIFAEIILQEIDIQAIGRIKEHSQHTYGHDYVFKRYVDDVFIFAKNSDIAHIVHTIYTDVLLGFNLHVNKSKSTEFSRPFITNKSTLIQNASYEANSFFDIFLDSEEMSFLKPKKIHSVWKLTRKFINSIKSICSQNSANYDEISNFLISVISERIKKIVAVSTIISDEENYKNALLVLLEIMFFLYQVSPSVAASYRLSTSIVLCIKFLETHLKEHLDTINQRIFELTLELITNTKIEPSNSVKSLVELEILNIVLAVKELGDNYTLPITALDKIFNDERPFSYFTIISCLYYSGNNHDLLSLKQRAITAVSQKLENLTDIVMDSEKAYLFLDVLNCPHIEQKLKLNWLKNVRIALQLQPKNKTELTNAINNSLSMFMSVKWNDLDLLRLLERKELKQAY